MQIIKYDQVADKVIEVEKQKVILDSDVAELYGVETRDINKAVKNNPEKFPNNYIIELPNHMKNELVENFHRFNKLKHSTASPKAFTERGLYMLATILKGEKAINTTLAIIDTFAKMKELTQAVYQFSKATADDQKISIFERSTDIIADLLDNELMVSQHETSIKIKLPFLEISRKITKIKK